MATGKLVVRGKQPLSLSLNCWSAVNACFTHNHSALFDFDIGNSDFDIGNSDFDIGNSAPSSVSPSVTAGSQVKLPLSYSKGA